MSNLRLATPADIPELLLLALEAHKESPHNLRFDAVQVKASIEGLIKDGVIICFIQDGTIAGLLAGITTLTPMSLEKVAAELLWYVLPKYRRTSGSLQMLDAFEYWAWSKECAVVCIANMENAYARRTDKIYKRKGYRLVEQSYMKELR